MQGLIDAGADKLWVEQRGEGPEVLLIGGLTDPVESWVFQLDGLADRYRLTAYDNPGAGRSTCPSEVKDVGYMADAAAAVLMASGTGPVHACGFSGGSMIAQELALRHPDLVKSLVLVSTLERFDTYLRGVCSFFLWLADVAPSERAMIEAFFLWIYTPRAHESGWVDAVIEDAMAFPHPQSPEAFKWQLDTFLTHDTKDRLHTIGVPTLVVAGELDITMRPSYGRAVADKIPGAEFVVLEGEAHQPFQESPEMFNALIDEFWRRVEA